MWGLSQSKLPIAITHYLYLVRVRSKAVVGIKVCWRSKATEKDEKSDIILYI